MKRGSDVTLYILTYTRGHRVSYQVVSPSCRRMTVAIVTVSKS